MIDLLKREINGPFPEPGENFEELDASDLVGGDGEKAEDYLCAVVDCAVCPPPATLGKSGHNIPV